MYVLAIVYIRVYSRFVRFIIRCLTQWGVGDCGHPVSVFHQDQHTEDNTVNARHLALLTLSLLLSLEYSNRNVRISTNSSISNGRRLSFCKGKKSQPFSVDILTINANNNYTKLPGNTLAYINHEGPEVRKQQSIICTRHCTVQRKNRSLSLDYCECVQ